MTYRNPDLPYRRQNHIIKHVWRNSSSTLAAIHDLFFPTISYDACRKSVTKLCQRGFLNRYQFTGNRNYYRLGPKAVSRWGFPESRTTERGFDGLTYDLGVLSYTCLDEQVRKRLLHEELKELFPWFPDGQLNRAYILRDNCLGTLRVEIRAQPATILNKFASQVYQLKQHPEFQALLDEGRFFIVCIVATSHQADALATEIAESDFSVPVEIVYDESLIPFI